MQNSLKYVSMRVRSGSSNALSGWGFITSALDANARCLSHGGLLEVTNLLSEMFCPVRD